MVWTCFFNKCGIVREDQDANNRLQKMSHSTREEYRRKLRKRRNLGRQIDGEAWLLLKTLKGRRSWACSPISLRIT
jgi:hypothetical protein